MEQTESLLSYINFYIKVLKEQIILLIILLLCFLHNSQSEVGLFICFHWLSMTINAVKYLVLVSQSWHCIKDSKV